MLDRFTRFAVLSLCAPLLLAPLTKVSADNQPPSIVNGIYATSIGDQAVRINWNRPWDDQGIDGYNIYRNEQYYATSFETFYVDNGISSGNEYRYQIVAFDAARNYSGQSAVATVQTNGGQANGGTVAPPAPENAPEQSQNGGSDRPLRPDGMWIEIVHGNSLTLHWQIPASNRPIGGYNIYRDDAYLTTVSGTSYTEDGITWGVNYNYRVVAFDETGRFSDPSDVITGNTAGADQAQNSQLQTDQTQSNQLQSNQPQNDTTNNNSPSSNGNPPHLDGYQLVFSDEFRGNSLDYSKWNTSYRWGAGWIINNEQQYYVDHRADPNFGYNPFQFDGEHLTISAIPTPEHLLPKAVWQPYLSGALTTYNKFKMKYGYVEMRAKMPRGRGLWSAFWLLHQHDNDRRPEIDVVEHIGHQPDLIYNTYHWQEGWNHRRTPSFEVWGPDYSQDFHTFGVRWEPGLIVWYVDGVEKHRLQDGNVSWEEMYLLANLAVGGWWPGSPDGTTSFPARLTIDYIRAYQR